MWSRQCHWWQLVLHHGDNGRWIHERRGQRLETHASSLLPVVHNGRGVDRVNGGCTGRSPSTAQSSETATNAAVVLRLCCSRSLICERREELAIGVLKLINSLPLAAAGEDDTVAGEAVAEPTGLPTSRDGEAEVEAAVMETAVVW